MNVGFGELAALTTAVAWGISSQIQGAVGRMVGPNSVTLLRMPYQIFFVTLMCLVFRADTSLTLYGYSLLLVSGILGIFMSDFLVYRAIYIIGPAMAILILSTSTMFATLFGWLILGETMPIMAIAGIGLALCGILTVVTEQTGATLLPGQEKPGGKDLTRGILLGAGAAATLALSFIFLKMSLKTGVDPLWATFVRLINGALALWFMGAVRGWVSAARRGLGQYPKIYWMLLISCSCGALGMWLSTIAIDLAPVGIASTLIGLQPIAVTIIGAVWYRRRLTIRILTGIAVAFGGTALICLS